MIAVSLLVFNPSVEVFLTIDSILAQNGTKKIIIIIDNNSNKYVYDKFIKLFLSRNIKVNFLQNTEDIANHKIKNNEIFIFRNNENRGFSAGNNIAFSIISKINIKYILVINPDVIMHNKFTISKLYKNIILDKNIVVSSCDIFDDNISKSSNPQRQLTFFDEFFKFNISKPPFQKKIKKNLFLIKKFSCSCFLIRTSFIHKIKYFSEKTFLYCEESILSEQIKKFNKKIIFTNNLSVKHNTINKKNFLLHRMFYLKSRIVYIKEFSNFNSIQKKIIILRCLFLLYLLRTFNSIHVLKKVLKCMNK